MTVLDHLLRSLAQAAEHNQNDLVAPRVILWTDGERLWESVIGLIRAAHPRVWTLGDYAPETRTGPAAFLRTRVPANAVPANEVPVLYLPGVARTAFRSAAECPEEVRHLFALQFEGQFWLQKNGKDWTWGALLAGADGGLGLDVARDAETALALRDCLAKVLEAPVATLTGRRLEAGDFRSLVADDPVRMLLRWIGRPAAWRQQWAGPEWSSFRAICRDDYGFDPEKDGELAAAEKLAAGENGWQPVWQRYGESPASYAGVEDVLAKVTPPDLFAVHEGYLTINDQREIDLRVALEALVHLPFEQARQRLLVLAQQEEPRADWVWAKLDRAPLAQAIAHLRFLVEAQAEFSGGQDWTGLANGYTRKGWEVDVAALHALALVRKPADLQAVGAALRGVYYPWLEKLAHTAQAHAATYPNRNAQSARSLTPSAGTVFVFVDGLRYDLGKLLAVELEATGIKVALGHEWAALPTVTATAKPAWKPLCSSLGGAGSSGAFEPAEIATGKPLMTARFRELLESLGIDYVKADTVGDPERCAWTEIGAFDSHGHDEGKKLAWRVEEQLSEVKHRIAQLLDAGWKHVRVITDHGWLMLPGGLPKLDLPKHLALSRWGRCATPQAGAKHNFPETSWFWDGSLPVVLAPGIGCFVSGLEYSHGGLTIQEALLPVLDLTSAAAPAAQKPELVAAKWKGLRLAATLKRGEGLLVDLRTKAADPTSSVLPADQRDKPVPAGGEISVLVENDDLTGSAVLLVLSATTGNVIFKHALNIGES